MNKNITHKNNTHMEKESVLRGLAQLGILLGYDADKPVLEIAEFSVMCQEAFHLEQKDSIKILWYMFDGML